MLKDLRFFFATFEMYVHIFDRILVTYGVET